MMATLLGEITITGSTAGFSSRLRGDVVVPSISHPQNSARTVIAGRGGWRYAGTGLVLLEHGQRMAAEAGGVARPLRGLPVQVAPAERIVVVPKGAVQKRRPLRRVRHAAL